jgi:endonuclease III
MRRVRAIRKRLAEVYGLPVMAPHDDGIGELILTVLSQSTNDRNRDVAYLRLRDRFGDWEAVRDAPVEEIEEAIRPGGISKVKSVRIKAILEAIGDPLDLQWMQDAPVEESREYLVALPGVGRKTAACVLLFAFDRPELPVDTHVYRVSSRLGLIRPKASFVEAHDTLPSLFEPDETYEVHVNMLRHGRRLCSVRRPQCERCPLLEVCPYGLENVRGK